MSIKYELTKEDIVAFQMYHLYHHQKIAPAMYLLALIVPIFILRILLWIYPSMMREFFLMAGWQRILAVVVVYMVGFLITRGLMRLLSDLGVEREKKKERNHLFGIRRIVFDEEGMTVNYLSYESTFTWSRMYKIVERKKYYFLYVNTETAHILPKRVLAEIGQEEAFANMLNSRATGKKGVSV